MEFDRDESGALYSRRADYATRAMVFTTLVIGGGYVLISDKKDLSHPASISPLTTQNILEYKANRE